MTVPDASSREQARARLDQVVGPDGEAGALGTLAIWWAGVRGCFPPPTPSRIRAVLVDGPEAREDPEVEDGPGVAGATGLAAAGAGAVRVAAGPAEPMQDAIQRGRSVADAEVDAGADLLVLAAHACTRVDVAAATLVAALLAREPVDVVGSRLRGGRHEDARWMADVAAVREGLRTVRRQAAGLDASDVLGAVSAPVLGVLAGVIGRAAARRTPVLLDGTAACTAALLAARWEPDCVPWLLAGSRPTSPAGVLALDAVDLMPVLDLKVQLDGAVGALVLVPLLRSATELLGRS